MPRDETASWCPNNAIRGGNGLGSIPICGRHGSRATGSRATLPGEDSAFKGIPMGGDYTNQSVAPYSVRPADAFPEPLAAYPICLQRRGPLLPPASKQGEPGGLRSLRPALGMTPPSTLNGTVPVRPDLNRGEWSRQHNNRYLRFGRCVRRRQPCASSGLARRPFAVHLPFRRLHEQHYAQKAARQIAATESRRRQHATHSLTRSCDISDCPGNLVAGGYSRGQTRLFRAGAAGAATVSVPRRVLPGTCT
jgi:hypothetical protein